jgi:hypothetical protein
MNVRLHMMANSRMPLPTLNPAATLRPLSENSKLPVYTRTRSIRKGA